jgi:glycosyltransferase involved in cell wall biosynthesis
MDKGNIAVIASRLKCVDAISVEAERWINKYERMGYKVCLIAGKFGEPVELQHFELPEMDYKHPEIRGIKRIFFGSELGKEGKKAAEILLNNLVKRIKYPLKNYIIKNKINILSIEDVLISLKNLPLNIALSQIIKETDLRVISRYHYLPTENSYFTHFNNFPRILSEIPLNTKRIVHVTNTQSVKNALAESKKIFANVIPNTMDLDRIEKIDDFNSDFRKALGIRDDQLIFLQPTRIKRNKHIERSIKLVAELNDIMKKDNVLVITGSPVYSRGNYFEEVVRKVNKQGVRVVFANDRIFLGRHQNKEQKFYSIHDAYVNCDVVLYPNISSAFGNPIIEAAAYKKPLVVNSFPNLKEFTDKGFEFVKMDGKVDAEVVSDTYELILNEQKRKEITEKNFELLKRNYSSEILDNKLIPILNEIERQLSPQKSFMSKVAELIPTSFKKMPFSKQEADKLKNNAGKNKDKADIKDMADIKDNADINNLKNKKGGYKEPVK